MDITKHMQREYISRKRRYSESAYTDVVSAKQSNSMARLTYNPNRTLAQRGQPYSRTERRGGRANIPTIPRNILSTVRRLNNQSSPAKHILYSDSGVTGGSATVFSTSSLVNSSPLMQLMNPLLRGMTVQTRIGDVAKVSKIHLNVRTTYGTAVDGDVIIKWILFAETNSQGYARTASQFASVYFGKTTPNTNAIPNYNNKDVSLFKILKTGQQTMRASMASVVEIRDWSVFWAPKTPLRCNYANGNAGTIADIDGNAIYLFMYTDFNVAGANSINSYIEGNVYFHDA